MSILVIGLVSLFFLQILPLLHFKLSPPNIQQVNAVSNFFGINTPFVDIWSHSLMTRESLVERSEGSMTTQARHDCESIAIKGLEPASREIELAVKRINH